MPTVIDDYKTISQSKLFPLLSQYYQHSGVDAWKAKIKETKDKYPKGDG